MEGLVAHFLFGRVRTPLVGCILFFGFVLLSLRIAMQTYHLMIDRYNYPLLYQRYE